MSSVQHVDYRWQTIFHNGRFGKKHVRFGILSWLRNHAKCQLIPKSLGNATFGGFMVGRASRLTSNNLPTQARRPRYIQKSKSKRVSPIRRHRLSAAVCSFGSDGECARKWTSLHTAETAMPPSFVMQSSISKGQRLDRDFEDLSGTECQ